MSIGIVADTDIAGNRCTVEVVERQNCRLCRQIVNLKAAITQDLLRNRRIIEVML